MTVASTLFVDEVGKLCFDVYSNRGLRSQFLYSVFLTQLVGREFHLRGGRFLYFTREPQPHAISVSLGKPLSTAFGAVVQWISENIMASWSMTINPVNVDEFGIEFSFADPADGAFFTLSWR